MKKNLIIASVLFLSICSFAQETDKKEPEPKVEKEKPAPKLTAAVDVVYPYLWRGIKYYGDFVAFQPYLNYAATDKLSFGVWATTNFSNAKDTYNEFDWSISYQFTPVVKLLLSDYYWPATSGNKDWEPSNYFDYSNGSAQTLDLQLVMDFTSKGVPIDFQWSTLIGGNDFKEQEFDENGDAICAKRAYSSYSEIGYTKTFDSLLGLTFRPFVGAVINGAYYGTDASGNTGLSFNNVGLNISKSIKISDNYEISVFVRYTNNNYGRQILDDEGIVTKTERNFFSCGLTFKIR